MHLLLTDEEERTNRRLNCAVYSCLARRRSEGRSWEDDSFLLKRLLRSLEVMNQSDSVGSELMFNPDLRRKFPFYGIRTPLLLDQSVRKFFPERDEVLPLGAAGERGVLVRQGSSFEGFVDSVKRASVNELPQKDYAVLAEVFEELYKTTYVARGSIVF